MVTRVIRHGWRTVDGVGAASDGFRIHRVDAAPQAGAPSVSNQDDTSTRHQYRTTSAHQMDDRTLLLRGGVYDGRSWTGVIAVGSRVFCGEQDAWSTEGIYLVTDQEETTENGSVANIAVPAFA